MAIKKYSRNIQNTYHNISSLYTDLTNLFIDRVSGINENGEEELIEHVGKEIHGSISILYSKSYRVINIYYDDDLGAITDEILNSNLLIKSSFSKYKRSGAIELGRVDLKSNAKIKPVITVENIGDAHISAVFNITLYDENGSPIDGYEIYAPISSDSVLYTKELGNRYTSRYGYVDDQKITDDSLLVERDDVFIFAIPINDSKVVKYSNGIISIEDTTASSVSFSGTIKIVNTDFTKLNHTPLIKNISLVMYS